MTAHAAAEHHHGPPAAHQSSRVDARVLGMFLFIASEIMLFGSFFTVYFFDRVVNKPFHGQWPPPPFDRPAYVAGLNTLLLIMTVRAFRGHFSPEHHHGMELAGIYWHFVDVMWVVVYVTVYLL